MDTILDYLRNNGELLETEIAEGTGMSPAQVRASISKLSATGKLVTCRVTRFEEGEKIEGILYRAAGYTPPVKRGRKPRS